jgi:hypothetical protein
VKRWGLVLLAACGSDDAPTDISCRQQLVYLNRTGGTFNSGGYDDAINNLSVVVDSERVLPAWPHSDADWQDTAACITTALAPLQRITLTEQDPGAMPHIELVFTTSYWAGGAMTHAIPASCRATHQIEFVFGNAIPTSARACHVAMQGFAQMTAQLSLGSECHDFVNNAQDCSTTRAFLDQTVDCVDTANQPAACRCGGGSTQNTLEALEQRFPDCP